MHLSPAAYIAFLFGGYSAVGRVIGVSRCEPRKWVTLQRKKQQHQAGLIPSWHHQTLMQAARDKGLDLTTNDLVYGREVPADRLANRALAAVLAPA